MIAVDTQNLSRTLGDVSWQNAGRLVAAKEVLTARIEARLGELCNIYLEDGSSVLAEVIGFDQGFAQLMCFQYADGTKHGDLVTGCNRRLMVPTGNHLLGRVIDATGSPLDGGPDFDAYPQAELVNNTPDAMSRARIDKPFATGQRTIDTLVTCGRGQRVALMAGSGVGKSMLLGEIAKGAEADVNVVALIGERGREVQPFLQDCLRDGLNKSVVVVATSEQTALTRVRGAQTAITIADAFRQQGLNVLLLLDSVTRLAMAQREIGLSLGEPPGPRGYTPSVFRVLATLLEQLGTSPNGSITGVLTVLVDGDDFDEPITDAVRSFVDGHIVLSRRLAERGHFPAIDVSSSVSRLFHEITTPAHRAAAFAVREIWTTLSEVEDLVRIGAYQRGASPKVDLAMALERELQQFLRQDVGDRTSMDNAIETLSQLAGRWRQVA